jgi:hypothetical protein
MITRLGIGSRSYAAQRTSVKKKSPTYKPAVMQKMVRLAYRSDAIRRE